MKELMSRVTMKYKKAKLVQSKVTSGAAWIEKISKLLTTPVAEKFIADRVVEENSLLFLAYGDKKQVVSGIYAFTTSYNYHYYCTQIFLVVTPGRNQTGIC